MFFNVVNGNSFMFKIFKTNNDIDMLFDFDSRKVPVFQKLKSLNFKKIVYKTIIIAFDQNRLYVLSIIECPDNDILWLFLCHQTAVT